MDDHAPYQADVKRSRVRDSMISVLVVMGLAILSYRALIRPAYNWDLIPYSYIVKKMSGEESHGGTFARLKAEMPSAQFTNLTTGSSFREKMYGDSVAFQQVLSMYQPKPLYLAVAFLAYSAGLPLIKSTVLPSVLGYFLTGLVLFIWMRSFHRVTVAGAGALLLLMIPHIRDVASFATPDFLAGMFIIGALFLMSTMRSRASVILMLCMAVLCRVDMVLLCLPLIWWSGFEVTRRSRLTFSAVLLLPVIFDVVCSGDAFFFIRFLKSMEVNENGFRFYEYCVYMKQQFLHTLSFSYLPLFMICLAIGIICGLLTGSVRSLILVFAAYIIIRFLVKPEMDDRFYISFYLSAVVMIANASAKRFQTGVLNG